MLVKNIILMQKLLFALLLSTALSNAVRVARREILVPHHQAGHLAWYPLDWASPSPRVWYWCISIIFINIYKFRKIVIRYTYSFLPSKAMMNVLMSWHRRGVLCLTCGQSQYIIWSVVMAFWLAQRSHPNPSNMTNKLKAGWRHEHDPPTTDVEPPHCSLQCTGVKLLKAIY